jgi:hypothetical protein
MKKVWVERKAAKAAEEQRKVWAERKTQQAKRKPLIAPLGAKMMKMPKLPDKVRDPHG